MGIVSPRLVLLAAMVLCGIAGCDGEGENGGGSGPSEDPDAPGKAERLAAQGAGYLARAEGKAAAAESMPEMREALDLYERAILALQEAQGQEEARANLEKAHLGRVEVLYRLRDFPRAEAAIRDALDAVLDSEARARLSLDRDRCLSEVAGEKGDFPAAIELLEKIVAADPDHRDSATRLAAVRKIWYLLLKRRLACAENLEEAFRSRHGAGAPTTDVHRLAFSVYDLARLALADGRPEETLEHCKHQALVLRELQAAIGAAFVEKGYHTMLSHFLNLSGVALVEKAEYDKAGEAFSVAADADPENEVATANVKILGLK